MEKKTEEPQDVALLLDAASGMRCDDHNPSRVIAAVNALIPLGKDAALLAIQRCATRQGSPDRTGLGLFWILRVLFVVTKEQGGYPVPLLGGPSVPPPSDRDLLPQYPIVVVDDVPLLAITGYTLSGFPQPVEQHIDYFRQCGSLRSDLLVPSTSSSRVEEDFERMWRRAYPDGQHLTTVLETIRPQIAQVYFS